MIAGCTLFEDAPLFLLFLLGDVLTLGSNLLEGPLKTRNLVLVSTDLVLEHSNLVFDFKDLGSDCRIHHGLKAF